MYIKQNDIYISCGKKNDKLINCITLSVNENMVVQDVMWKLIFSHYIRENMKTRLGII